MTLLQIPKTDSISQIALRNQQSSLLGTQNEALKQQTQQKKESFGQTQRLALLDYQTKQQEYEDKKAVYWGGRAKAAGSAPLAMRMGEYNKVYEDADNSGEDVSNYPLPFKQGASPEEWTDAYQGALNFVAHSAIKPAKQLELQQKQQLELEKLAKGVDQPAAVREYEYFNRLDPQKQQQFLNVKRNVLQTGLGFDEEGNVVPLEGAPQAKQTIKQSEALGTAEGKAQSISNEELKSMESKIPELEATVKDLGKLAKEATYTKTGIARDNTLRQLGRPMSKGGLARAEYISIVDNQILPLLRDTFGAAFTEREGQTLRATLGDPNATPSEKQAKLNAFIRQKKASVSSLKRKLGYKKGKPAETNTNLQSLSDDDLMKQLGL